MGQAGSAARAETWLRRTVGVARRASAWEVYGRAFLLLGELHADRGHHAAARVFLVRAFRTGRRHTLRELRADALYRLFLLARGEGDAAAAERLARQALRASPAGHAARPTLLRDVAALWMERGWHRRAVGLLRRLASTLGERGERLTALVLLARAAAAAGECDPWADVWEEAWALLGDLPGEPSDAGVVLELAETAASFGDWRRMEQAVRLAQSVAVRSGDTATLDRTMPLLRQVRERR